jgi:hypothetical protein
MSFVYSGDFKMDKRARLSSSGGGGGGGFSKDHTDNIVSAHEVEIRHIYQTLDHLDSQFQQGFSQMSQQLEALRHTMQDDKREIMDRKQPLTAFAGWAAVILSLGYAFGYPLMQRDTRFEHRIDRIEARELLDAESRGMSNQMFATLNEKVDGSIANRKDLDAKHMAAQQSLSDRIDELSHSLDNGLGRRIGEMLAPVEVKHAERLLAIERKVFNEPSNARDIENDFPRWKMC